MVFFCVAGLQCGRLFSLGLDLLLLVAASVSLAMGQDGVSLKLLGVTIPNNSLVDIDDILYRAPIDGYREDPTNVNPKLHDQALLCVTDLVDCCDAPRTVRGEWYYPDGRRVEFDARGSTFRRNRGPNELINGRQFYGSVRLFRQWSRPSERGQFRCELPSAADPNVTQTLYANIVDFYNPVTVSAFGLSIAGKAFSLMCSATLTSPIPLPSNVPSPKFEWFYGPYGNASLPSGVTPTATNLKNCNIYASTLQFSPTLNESHAGMYTCRLGAGRLGAGQLVGSTVVSLDVAVIQIIPSGAPVVGQNSYTLTCRVLVADNHCSSITYQWTKNNGTDIQHGNKPNTLSFSPLRLSDAGQYTCYATVSSLYLTSDITLIGSRDIRIRIPAPTSVTISSSTVPPNPVQPVGSDVTLKCTVHMELSPAVDVPVTVNTVWTGPAGFRTTSTSQPVIDGVTTYSAHIHVYTSTAMISSFGRNQSGVYTCAATLHSTLTKADVINSIATFNSTRITTGVYLALRNQFITNNSQVNIRSIGLSSNHSDSNNALQCITDRIPCCLGEHPRPGEWYLSNGKMVLIQGGNSSTVFYRNRGDNGEVSLNRPSGVMSPTGQFCCQVPDAVNVNQTLCVTIVEVSTIPFGSAITGESYTLECSAGGSMATFEWLGPPDGRTSVINSSSIMINSNSSTSQLQFRPLQQSHSGSYLCRAMTDEDTLSSEPVEINVKAPMIAIHITDSAGGAVPTTGEDYDLVCSVIGAEKLNPTITYQWRKNGDMSQSNSNTLSLIAPVRVSDAGTNYSCLVTIASSYLTGNIAAMTSYIVRIQIPTSSSIALTSSKANFNQIVGSDVTLTCAVKLHPAILGSEIFLLVVDAQLSRDRTPLALAGPIVTGTTFTYTARVNVFGRSDYGNYTCTATVRPQPSSTYFIGVDVLSDTLSIKVFIPPPVDVQATQSSSSAPVEVSWSPPVDHGAFNITGYRIFYGSGKNISLPTVATNIGLKVNEKYDSQIVFLRSESDQLHSELVYVTVENKGLCSSCNAKCPYSCSSEIGATVGVMVCLVVMAIIVIAVVLCWWRKKSSARKDLAVSVNVAYKDVKSEAEKIEGEYENLDIILKSSGLCTDTDHKFKTATASTICTCEPADSGTDEAMCVTSRQQ